jgi:hypothetical protein
VAAEVGVAAVVAMVTSNLSCPVPNR